MKILHVIPSLSPLMGGPTQVALNLVRALRDQGAEVEIVTTDDHGPSGRLSVPLNQRVEYEKVPVWFLPRFSPRLKDFIFSWPLTQWLWRNIQHYSLLDHHYLFSYAPTCAAAIARWQRVPYTVRTMGQLTPWALAQGRLKKKLYWAVAERRNLDGAALIHCTSTGEAEDVRRVGVQTPTATLPLGVNIGTVIPNARQILHERYQIPLKTPIVLFLARLHYKKRPDLLIRSLQHLKETLDFHLLLAGSGEVDYTNHLLDLMRSSGLSSRVSLPGFVDGEDKQLLLQGSDLFVLPSFSENFGIAVAEAMAAGIPVVITPDVQIAPDVNAAEAGLVVPGELGSVSAAIAQLLSSDNLRQKLGNNAQKFAQTTYSWKAIAAKQLVVYDAIINQKPLPAYSH